MPVILANLGETFLGFLFDLYDSGRFCHCCFCPKGATRIAENWKFLLVTLTVFVV